MQPKLDSKDYTAKKFSSVANHYDSSSDIQLIVADYLQNMIYHLYPQLMNIQTAIDIGCGTGLMTEKILTLFPSLKIVGVDIAQNMVTMFNKKFSHKENVQAIKSDFLTFDYRHQFDMAFCSSALHWIIPVEKAINKVYQLLKQKAFFFCGMTVSGTFDEFLKIKKQIAPEKSTNNQFLSSSEVITYLKKNNFIVVEKAEENFAIPYNSTMEFIKKIHLQGTTAFGFKKSLLTRKELNKLISLYDKKFMNSVNKIEIKYNILFFCAQKI